MNRELAPGGIGVTSPCGTARKTQVSFAIARSEPMNVNVPSAPTGTSLASNLTPVGPE